MKQIHGIFAVTVTHFQENGEIDYAACAKHINWLIESGVHGLLPLGATGEFSALTLEERKAFAEFAMKEVAGRVPVIIGAVLEGPVVGFVIGLIFGLFSLYRAAVGGSVLAPLFLNPVVTILPRVLIGPVAYYVFRGISHLTRKRALSVGAAAVAGTLTNTIGVMGLIFILYAQQYADLMGISRQGVGLAILSASAVNGIPECILAAVVTVAVVLAVWKLTGSGPHSGEPHSGSATPPERESPRKG